MSCNITSLRFLKMSCNKITTQEKNQLEYELQHYEFEVFKDVNFQIFYVAN
jgi:hypothetical protein